MSTSSHHPRGRLSTRDPVCWVVLGEISQTRSGGDFFRHARLGSSALHNDPAPGGHDRGFRPGGRRPGCHTSRQQGPGVGGTPSSAGRVPGRVNLRRRDSQSLQAHISTAPRRVHPRRHGERIRVRGSD